MLLHLQRVVTDWQDFLINKQDPRVAEWFLVSSPQSIIAVVALYLSVVVYGPRWMKNRNPYNLKPVLYLYNAFQVALSAYMFTEIAVVSWSAGYSLKCQKVDYGDDPLAIRIAQVSWWYFFSKIIDLLDTVFFVLRKKSNQISFLHVYHHSTILYMSWLSLKYAPGGQGFVTGLLNTFVHTIMYTYYFLSTLGPRVQRFLWWKKYLTQLQLVQFFLIIGHAWMGVYYRCDYPSILTFLSCFYPVTMIALFGNFYIRSYLNKRKIQ